LPEKTRINSEGGLRTQGYSKKAMFLSH